MIPSSPVVALRRPVDLNHSGPSVCSVTRLEAHELSLSAPSTPVSLTPTRKSSTSGTPSVLRRQLQTITENIDQSRKKTNSTSTSPASQTTATPSLCHRLSLDESSGSGGSLRESLSGHTESISVLTVTVKSKPLNANSKKEAGIENGRKKVDGTESAISSPFRAVRIKKSKSLSSKLWMKRNGGKSAPCSPEPQRRSAFQDKVRLCHALFVYDLL